MATKREYLVGLGLAKEGRGRFGKDALAALAKAEAEGIVFDEPTVKPASAKPKVKQPTVKADKAPKVSLVKQEKPKVSEQRAERPTPLLMPKRRPENSGFTQVRGILIRQDKCGNCTNAVSRCACTTGPRAYKWLEKEVGGPLVLTLDKPSL